MQVLSPDVVRFFNNNELYVETFDSYINIVSDWDKAKNYFLPFLVSYLKKINYFKEDLELYETDTELNTYISFINKSIRLRDLNNEDFIGILSCDIMYRLLEDLDRDQRRFNVFQLLTDKNYSILERFAYYRAFSLIRKLPTIENFDEKFNYVIQQYEAIELPKVVKELQRVNTVQGIVDAKEKFNIPLFMHGTQEEVVNAMESDGLGHIVEMFDLTPVEEVTEDDVIAQVLARLNTQ